MTETESSEPAFSKSGKGRKKVKSFVEKEQKKTPGLFRNLRKRLQNLVSRLSGGNASKREANFNPATLTNILSKCEEMNKRMVNLQEAYERIDADINCLSRTIGVESKEFIRRSKRSDDDSRGDRSSRGTDRGGTSRNISAPNVLQTCELFNGSRRTGNLQDLLERRIQIENVDDSPKKPSPNGDTSEAVLMEPKTSTTRGEFSATSNTSPSELKRQVKSLVRMLEQKLTPFRLSEKLKEPIMFETTTLSEDEQSDSVETVSNKATSSSSGKQSLQEKSMSSKGYRRSNKSVSTVEDSMSVESTSMVKVPYVNSLDTMANIQSDFSIDTNLFSKDTVPIAASSDTSGTKTTSALKSSSRRTKRTSEVNETSRQTSTTPRESNDESNVSTRYEVSEDQKSPSKSTEPTTVVKDNSSRSLKNAVSSLESGDSAGTVPGRLRGGGITKISTTEFTPGGSRVSTLRSGDTKLKRHVFSKKPEDSSLYSESTLVKQTSSSRVSTLIFGDTKLKRHVFSKKPEDSSPYSESTFVKPTSRSSGSRGEPKTVSSDDDSSDSSTSLSESSCSEADNSESALLSRAATFDSVSTNLNTMPSSSSIPARSRKSSHYTRTHPPSVSCSSMQTITTHPSEKKHAKVKSSESCCSTCCSCLPSSCCSSRESVSSCSTSSGSK